MGVVPQRAMDARSALARGRGGGVTSSSCGDDRQVRGDDHSGRVGWGSVGQSRVA